MLIIIIIWSSHGPLTVIKHSYIAVIISSFTVMNKAPLLHHMLLYICIWTCLCVQSVTSNLLFDDFTSTTVNSFGGERTDDGAAGEFLTYNAVANTMTLVVFDEPDVYIRSVIGVGGNVCYDLSRFNAITFTVKAAPRTRVSLSLSEGNKLACDASVFPIRGILDMVDVHHYVEGQEFNGDTQTVVIPLSHFRVDISAVYDFLIDGVHHLDHTAASAVTIGAMSFISAGALDGVVAPQPRAGMIQTCGAGKLALTFDDGLSTNMPALLDILDEFDAKATFFTVGRRLEVNN